MFCLSVGVRSLYPVSNVGVSGTTCIDACDTLGKIHRLVGPRHVLKTSTITLIPTLGLHYKVNFERTPFRNVDKTRPTLDIPLDSQNVLCLY